MPITVLVPSCFVRLLSWPHPAAPTASIPVSNISSTVIEGDGKAILYTGDIRSEPWFINSVSRNPSIVEFSSGIKRLDKIYLDTSFIFDIPFQTKAEGIQELLRKVAKYPDDTIFHFQAWTYGYEDVWIALSKALKSRVSLLPNTSGSRREGLTNSLLDSCRSLQIRCLQIFASQVFIRRSQRA
jgi:hypothetical protein